MIIEDHAIHMESMRDSVQHHEKDERLTVWQGDTRVDMVNGERATSLQTQRAIRDSVSISQEGMQRFVNSAKKNAFMEPIVKTADAEEETALTPELQMMKSILEKFFGIKIDVVTPEEMAEGEGGKQTVTPTEGQPTPQADQQELQGWGIDYSYHETNYTKETVQFKAAGTVTTQDGRELNFETQLEMSKETYEEINVSFKAGDALIDPLVVNFDKMGAQLTNEKYDFDLNADGEKEKISFVTQGSGFLALDKNNNNTIDDGSELFGPQTNNGFAELKAYDNDQNGWIDEKDKVFYDLRIWSKNQDGSDSLSTLTERNVGAIYLDSISTQFKMDNGQVRETGLYLEENGTTGFIQEVDLKVE